MFSPEGHEWYKITCRQRGISIIIGYIFINCLYYICKMFFYLLSRLMVSVYKHPFLLMEECSEFPDSESQLPRLEESIMHIQQIIKKLNNPVIIIIIIIIIIMVMMIMMTMIMMTMMMMMMMMIHGPRNRGKAPAPPHTCEYFSPPPPTMFEYF